MKKVSLVLGFVLMACAASAQLNFNWTKLNTGTTKDIYDMYFHSPDTGYIVGEDYLFKKTTDGGQTWKDLPTPTTGEKAGNNGAIIAIDFHPGAPHSQVDSGLFITWQKGYEGAITGDEGASYQPFTYLGSTIFCSIRGFRALEENQGNGYVNLITYGESCTGNATYYNFYNGPFAFPHGDSTVTPQPNSVTGVDRGNHLTIFAHSDGYLRPIRWVTGQPDSIFLDSTGVTAVHSAGKGTWYAATNSGLNNMYRSTDSGKTFAIDATFPQTFHYPQINDLSFIEPELGIVAGISNGMNGVIIHRDTSGWFFLTAEQPLNKAKLFENGVAYVVGENGLMMRTGPFPPKDTAQSIVEINTIPISVYPNPAGSTIYLDASDGGRLISSLTLVQLNGQEVKAFAPEQRILDVSDLARGMYLLVMEYNGLTERRKVVLR